MKFKIQREAILKPLQTVSGVVERKKTLEILSHILVILEGSQLSLIATDIEVELEGKAKVDSVIKGSKQSVITIPGRKFLDICRALPENSIIEITEDAGKIVVTSANSRFLMSSLSPSEFPRAPFQESLMEFAIPQSLLRSLINKTSFAIPQQDVRQYLNGLLLEVKDGSIQVLATDGHRLAISSVNAPVIDNSFAQVIIPRRGVLELGRLLNDSDEEALIGLNNNYIRVAGGDFIFTSKLISGKFPNYNKIIPKKGENVAIINRNDLKYALVRVGVLSNELMRSVRFVLRHGQLQLLANNPAREEAVDAIAVKYQGDNIDTIFNIGYLQDIVNVLEGEDVTIYLKDSESSVVIEEQNSQGYQSYVLMPITI